MRVTSLYEPKLVELWNERARRLRQGERQRGLRGRVVPYALQAGTDASAREDGDGAIAVTPNGADPRATARS